MVLPSPAAAEDASQYAAHDLAADLRADGARGALGRHFHRAFAPSPARTPGPAEQAVEPFRLTDRLSNSERAMLMGGACAKAYGWSPSRG